MTFIQPLDLQTIFVNYLAGNMAIFLFLVLIGIAALAAMFRMPNSIAMIIFGVFAVIMGKFIPDLYFIAIILGGLAIFYGVIKMFKY